MPIFSALVLFAMIWFITLLCVLVIRQPSQAEAGDVIPGTHPGAPADPQLRKRLRYTTIISVVLWVPLVWVISSGMVTIDSINLYERFGPGSR